MIALLELTQMMEVMLVFLVMINYTAQIHLKIQKIAQLDQFVLIFLFFLLLMKDKCPALMDIHVLKEFHCIQKLLHVRLVKLAINLLNMMPDKV